MMENWQVSKHYNCFTKKISAVKLKETLKIFHLCWFFIYHVVDPSLLLTLYWFQWSCVPSPCNADTPEWLLPWHCTFARRDVFVQLPGHCCTVSQSGLSVMPGHAVLTEQHKWMVMPVRTEVIFSHAFFATHGTMAHTHKHKIHGAQMMYPIDVSC